MKKLSTEQKQLVYEFLLEKGVPDLYAALIAARQVNPMSELFTVSATLYGGFDWVSSTEGLHFWCDLIDEFRGNIPEYAQNKIDIVLEDKSDVVEHKVEDKVKAIFVEDVKSSAGENFIAIGTNFSLDKEIETIGDDEVFGYVEESYRPQQPQEYLDYLNKMKTDLSFSELNLWQKIKLFFGGIFYKV